MKTKRSEPIEAVPRREIDIFDDMDRMFDTLFHRGRLRPFHEVWSDWVRFDEAFDADSPRVDVIDRGEEVLVRAEVAGVDRKDLEAGLTGRTKISVFLEAWNPGRSSRIC